jgi:tetratricopeptide (TPR) repeat protein
MRSWVLLLFFSALFIYADEPVAAKIMALEGDVRIVKKSDGKESMAQLLGMLFDGDSLKTGTGSSATVLYASGKILAIGDQTQMEIKGAGSDTLRGKAIEGAGATAGDGSVLFAFVTENEAGTRKLMVRGPEDSFVIYRPGNTVLMDNRPGLLWSSCLDAQAYVAVFQKMGDIVMSVITVDTFLVYPQTMNDLEPGSYMLKISAIKGSDTVGTVARFVRILKPGDIADVKNLLEQIAAQKCDPFTLHLLNAQVYEKKGLTADAIGQYEALLSLEPDAAVVHQALYALYTKLGVQAAANKHLDRYRELTQ